MQTTVRLMFVFMLLSVSLTSMWEIVNLQIFLPLAAFDYLHKLYAMAC